MCFEQVGKLQKGEAASRKWFAEGGRLSGAVYIDDAKHWDLIARKTQAICLCLWAICLCLWFMSLTAIHQLLVVYRPFQVDLTDCV